MKDEIKEILECMSKVIFHEQGMALNTEECKTLLDYITNLQEENERLNNIINELEKDLWEVRQLTFTKYNSNEWNNCLSFNDDIRPILDKLKELKENK